MYLIKRNLTFLIIFYKTNNRKQLINLNNLKPKVKHQTPNKNLRRPFTLNTQLKFLEPIEYLFRTEQPREDLSPIEHLFRTEQPIEDLSL